MANLVENAANYGGGVTDIAVARTADGRVAVMVDDAGPGIEPDERARIFERFYRGSASGRRGTGTGTGLGLALVAEHVRAMHGDVNVESSPEGGARFVVTLPVLGDDAYEDSGDGEGTGDGRSQDRRAKDNRRNNGTSGAHGSEQGDGSGIDAVRR